MAKRKPKPLLPLAILTRNKVTIAISVIVGIAIISSLAFAAAGVISVLSQNKHVPSGNGCYTFDYIDKHPEVVQGSNSDGTCWTSADTKGCLNSLMHGDEYSWADCRRIVGGLQGTHYFCPGESSCPSAATVPTYRCDTASKICALCKSGESGCSTDLTACNKACTPPQYYRCQLGGKCGNPSTVACTSNELGCRADLDACNKACAPPQYYRCNNNYDCAPSLTACKYKEPGCYTTKEECTSKCNKPTKFIKCNDDKNSCISAPGCTKSDPANNCYENTASGSSDCLKACKQPAVTYKCADNRCYKQQCAIGTAGCYASADCDKKCTPPVGCCTYKEKIWPYFMQKYKKSSGQMTQAQCQGLPSTNSLLSQPNWCGANTTCNSNNDCNSAPISISGTVLQNIKTIDFGGNSGPTPISGANVTLVKLPTASGAKNPPPQTTVADGKFTFANLEKSDYGISITANGYVMYCGHISAPAANQTFNLYPTIQPAGSGIYECTPDARPPLSQPMQDGISCLLDGVGRQLPGVSIQFISFGRCREQGIAAYDCHTINPAFAVDFNPIKNNSVDTDNTDKTKINAIASECKLTIFPEFDHLHISACGCNMQKIGTNNYFDTSACKAQLPPYACKF